MTLTTLNNDFILHYDFTLPRPVLPEPTTLSWMKIGPYNQQ